MAAYYYLVAGLPDITLEDGKLSYNIDSFKSEMYPYLSDEDKTLMDFFYLKYDNENLLRLLHNKDADTNNHGLYSKEDLLALIDAVKTNDNPDKRYPSYFYDFVSEYFVLPPEEMLKAEDMLAANYYSYAMRCNNRFVARWFEFNLNLNNILAAITARKYKLDVPSVIVGDNDVCESLRTSNARDFGLNDVIDYFESIQRIQDIEELVEREKKLDLLKWNWMDDESFFNYFTIERLFIFLVRLEMIERWLSLDKEKGMELFRMMVGKLKDEVQIPDEFKK